MPTVIDKADQPKDPGGATTISPPWALEALQRVLKDKPERLDWREVDNAAQNERRDRLVGLAAQSARAPYPLPGVHAELDRLMDEFFNPPTAGALASTSPRSAVSIEMETD